MLELLASHYGTQLTETTEVAEAKNDIDSGTFDADAYTRDLLADKTLPDLIAYQETLAKKARSLDSSMQNLVYENYNKFIRATETIREMRDSVGELEAEMSRLRTAIDKTGTTSAKLTSSLSSNRSKIEQLAGVRGLISKLEFLFQLPARLRSCLELGAHQQAVKFYRAASRVLRAHSSVASFAAIAAEADSIAEQLRERLRAPLADGSSRAADVAESARLLLLLGEPPRPLITSFLRWHERRLRAALRGAVAAAGAGDDDDDDDASTSASGAGAGRAEGGSSLSVEAAARTAARRLPVGDPYGVVTLLNRNFTDAFVRTAKAFSSLRAIAVREADEGKAARRRRRRQRRAGARADEDDDDGEDYDDDGAEADDGDDSASSDGEEAVAASAGDREARAAAAADRLADMRALSGEFETFAAECFAVYFSAVKRAVGRADAVRALLRRSQTGSPGAAPAEAAEAAAAADAGGEEGGMAEGATGRNVVAAVEAMLLAVRVPARLVPGAGLTDKAEAAAVALLRGCIHGAFDAFRTVVCALMARSLAECAAAPPLAVEAPVATQLPAAAAAGAQMRVMGTRLADDAVALLRAALAESRPAVLGGIRLLPDFARGFPGMLHGNALSAMLWLSAVAEAAADSRRRHGPGQLARAARAVAAAITAFDGSDVTDPAASAGVLRSMVAAVRALPPLPRLVDASDSLAMAVPSGKAASSSLAAASAGAGAHGAPGALWGPSRAPVCAGQPVPSAGALRSAALHLEQVGFAACEASAVHAGAMLPRLGRPAAGGSAAVRAAEAAVVLACFTERLGGGGARRCLEALQAAQPTRAELLAAGSTASEDDMEAQSSLSGAAMGTQERQLCQQALASAARLAEAAGRAAGGRLEQSLARSARAADWGAMPEPRGCRPAAGLAAREAAVLWAMLRGAQSRGAAAEAAAAAGGVTAGQAKDGLTAGVAPRMPPADDDDGDYDGATGAESGAGGAAAGGVGGGLEGDLDRLFASDDAMGGGGAGGGGRRSEWEAVGAMPLAAEPVVAVALRESVWGFAEALRDVDDLGEHGFAQAQVDVAVLAAATGSMLRGKRWLAAVEAGLAEALSSAADRAPPGGALPSAVVAIAAKESLRSLGLPEGSAPLRVSPEKEKDAGAGGGGGGTAAADRGGAGDGGAVESARDDEADDAVVPGFDAAAMGFGP